MAIELRRAIGKVETAIDSAITPAGIYIEPVLDAARRLANSDLRPELYKAIRTGTRRPECNLNKKEIWSGVDAVFAALGYTTEDTE